MKAELVRVIGEIDFTKLLKPTEEEPKTPKKILPFTPKDSSDPHKPV